jgi:hypothetical protein
MIQCGLHHLAQAFKSTDVAFFKRVRAIGQQFKNTVHFIVAKQWHYHDRRDTQRFAALAVYPRIRLRVITAQNLFRTNAFTGKARFHLEVCPDLGRHRPRACATDNLFTAA